ncbi:Rieske (2Fe-2S) protein [Agrobacterium vitis]|uniref:Rieske 2Fe-2S domain-containing protein n=1 Tax=Agrobacterium vitis TaxID=373 RepID=UPI0012E96DD6|nr:Rieske (2Fe-2S) protein [Agrobacterium vitis]MVA22979.1 Rieske 2Fe-2S domain-containing protein [Agrobacterium vitis]
MTTEAGWMPVALSTAIEPGTSAGAVVDGAEIVIWRDVRGLVHVWEDRCPHRGMRMSFGFVRGDHIACLYHGWSYDAGGQCTHIPAHPDLDVPKTIKIASYAVQERNGVIWTALADSATPEAIPDLGLTLAVRSLYVDCTPQRAMDGLMVAHLPVGKGLEAARFEVLASNVWRLEAGDLHLAIAVQRIAPQKIGLHIVTDERSVTSRPALARWAQALRLSLETPIGLEASGLGKVA